MKENIVALSVNINESFFRKIFSKLEFLTAYSYVHKKVVEMNLPSFFIDFLDSPNGLFSENSFLQGKIDSIMSREAGHANSEGDFDATFHVLVNASRKYSLDHDHYGNFFEYLKNSSRRVIYLAGFMTEFNITAMTLKLFDMGYLPVVIGDAVSSSRERMHFEALEILSNFSQVVDSRDLIREWDGGGI